MLKRCAVIALVCAFAIPARADVKDVLTFIPKKTAKAAKNMAMPWKDPLTAGQQWLTTAAVFYDARGTTRSVAACLAPYCKDRNAWLYGARPHGARLRLGMGVVAALHVTVIQIGTDVLETEGFAVHRFVPFLAYTAPVSSGHFLAGRGNLNLAERCNRAELRCR